MDAERLAQLIAEGIEGDYPAAAGGEIGLDPCTTPDNPVLGIVIKPLVAQADLFGGKP